MKIFPTILLFCGLLQVSTVTVQGQTAGKIKAQKKIPDSVSLDFIRAEDGYLYFHAKLQSSKKEKTTLFVRDHLGELVYEDKLAGFSLDKIYKIPSGYTEDLVFEWVNPQRMLLKKFKVLRTETSFVTVTKLN